MIQPALADGTVTVPRTVNLRQKTNLNRRTQIWFQSRSSRSMVNIRSKLLNLQPNLKFITQCLARTHILRTSTSLREWSSPKKSSTWSMLKDGDAAPPMIYKTNPSRSRSPPRWRAASSSSSSPYNDVWSESNSSCSNPEVSLSVCCQRSHISVSVSESAGRVVVVVIGAANMPPTVEKIKE